LQRVPFFNNANGGDGEGGGGRKRVLAPGGQGAQPPPPPPNHQPQLLLHRKRGLQVDVDSFDGTGSLSSPQASLGDDAYDRMAIPPRGTMRPQEAENNYQHHHHRLPPHLQLKQQFSPSDYRRWAHVMSDEFRRLKASGCVNEGRAVAVL